jgi:hypothetical protein
MKSQKGHYNKYNLDELREESVDTDLKYRTIKPLEEVEDNKLKSKAWTNAYSFASYYLENPTSDYRTVYLNKFRFNFHGLLSQTNSPSELPDLRSRESLVLWVCKKHNEFLEKNSSEFRTDCNAQKLISQFGPNYNKIKNWLGEHDYYL